MAGAGADTMDGAGDDRFVDNIGDVVREDPGQGNDTVQSTIDYALSADAEVENLTLIAAANINGTGNALNNLLTGNDGNNQLNGLDGNDAHRPCRHRHAPTVEQGPTR